MPPRFALYVFGNDTSQDGECIVLRQCGHCVDQEAKGSVYGLRGQERSQVSGDWRRRQASAEAAETAVRSRVSIAIDSLAETQAPNSSDVCIHW
mmetsp:Transcript_19934/g.40561  ORF Transcript_19934/g.40561 Transcript_19934/m.40561 type:complete len:94 (+) Transcript_19934:357-638(+)